MLFVEDTNREVIMWIVVVYFCTLVGCSFADSRPTYSQVGCLENAAQVSLLLQADDDVILFDVVCLHVRMTES
jgi:hypothetical protein